MEEEGPRQVAFCSELRGSGETGESFFFFFCLCRVLAVAYRIFSCHM